MSAFSGSQGRGAGRARRKLKREQAEARNANTAPDRRRAYRRDPANRLLVEVFAEQS